MYILFKHSCEFVRRLNYISTPPPPSFGKANTPSCSHTHFIMHAVGIHSALAIKRQRKRRDEQKRARERRYSVQSSESGDTQHSPHGSTRRGYHPHSVTHAAGNGMLDTKVIANAIGRKGQATDKSGCACVHVRIYVVCNWKRVLSIDVGGHQHRNAAHWCRFCGVWHIPDRLRYPAR